MPVVTGAAQSLVLHPPHRLCLPLLAPCHNAASPSPPAQGQGLPLSPALPASPRGCLLMAPGGLKPPFSHFSSLCAASPWAHAPAGPPTMLLPPALLCCLMPSCLHLAGPSPAREGSEHKGGGRSPISLCGPSWITQPVGALSELPTFPMSHAVSIPSGNPLECTPLGRSKTSSGKSAETKFLCSPELCQSYLSWEQHRVEPRQQTPRCLPLCFFLQVPKGPQRRPPGC